MKRTNLESPVRLRILQTARDLFYRQGYRATGINEIIKKSGVAKASFYAYFPSKESLAVAYVQAMNVEETRALAEAVQKFKSPYEKLIGLIDFLIPWAEASDYRGCTYLNISSEILDHAHPIRRESIAHYDWDHRLILKLLHELKDQKGAAWKNRDVEALARDYMLIFTGALALAQLYHQPKPFQDAKEAVRRLLA